jgi:4-amino-4-deoxy-L-arabinose transferase-like glycosyltransferase
VLVICVPGLLIDLREADVMTNRESIALRTSRETWQRHRSGEKLAWLIPSLNGDQAIDPPPMGVWLQMAAWSDLDPQTATADDLIGRARLVSTAMAMITLIATFWAGVSIGGVRVARLATIALGTVLLFTWQMRTASPEAMMVAFSTLGIAAGLWAMRPLKEVNWVGRRVVGWFIAGLCMSAVVLCKGPLSMVVLLPPLLAAILLTRRRRTDNMLGLLFAVILGIIAAAPWYLYVLDQVPQAWERLYGQYAAPRDLFLLSWSHARAFAMMSPWQVWLVGALFQPFLRATSSDHRRQLLIAWFWFVLLFIAFSIPGASHPRYLLPVLPAAALMIGQLWSYHAHLATERRHDPGVNWLRLPHWTLLAIASVFGPLFILAQPTLIEQGRLPDAELAGLSTVVVLGMAGTLLLLTVLGAWLHALWFPRVAFYLTAAWMMVACTVCYGAYARSYHNVNPYVADAHQVDEAIGAERAVLLHPDEGGRPLDQAFLFYLGRVVRSVGEDRLASLATGEGASNPCSSSLIRTIPAATSIGRTCRIPSNTGLACAVDKRSLPVRYNDPANHLRESSVISSAQHSHALHYTTTP